MTLLETVIIVENFALVGAAIGYWFDRKRRPNYKLRWEEALTQVKTSEDAHQAEIQTLITDGLIETVQKEIPVEVEKVKWIERVRAPKSYTAEERAYRDRLEEMMDHERIRAEIVRMRKGLRPIDTLDDLMSDSTLNRMVESRYAYGWELDGRPIATERKSA